MEGNTLQEVSLPLRIARDFTPNEIIKESVNISISPEMDEDIDMEIVDNNHGYHTYKVPKTYRNWLDYNAWPDSDSDTESTMSEEMMCWCLMVNDEHDDVCELDEYTDEEESEEENSDNNENHGNRSDNFENPNLNTDPTMESDNLQTLQEFDINDLKFRALMALDGKSFVSLGVIQHIIRELSGPTLLDMFINVAGLRRSNLDAFSQTDATRTKHDIKLVLRLCAALESQDVRKYCVYFGSILGLNCENYVISAINSVLSLIRGSSDVDYTIRAMRLNNMKTDANAILRTMRILQMATDTELVIRAMCSLQRTNEEKLRELFQGKLEEMAAEKIYNFLSHQLWHLSKKEKYQLGEEALKAFNHGGRTFFDEE